MVRSQVKLSLMPLIGWCLDTYSQSEALLSLIQAQDFWLVDKQQKTSQSESQDELKILTV